MIPATDASNTAGTPARHSSHNGCRFKRERPPPRWSAWTAPHIPGYVKSTMSPPSPPSVSIETMAPGSRDTGDHARRHRELSPALASPSIVPQHGRSGHRAYRLPLTCPLFSIAGFLQREMRPAVSVVSDKNATSFRSIDDVVVVAHVRPQDANLYDRFAALARHYRDRCSFGVAWEARDAHERPALACYHNVDDVQHATAELGTVGALEAFLQRCVEPVIPELTRRNEWQYMSVRKTVYTRGEQRRTTTEELTRHTPTTK
ncbi:hypothetical protein VTK73DRAFT_6080 [Phialemonium thermophilum]|uniref:ABM domain-containing protein n=1 Tax=Phialemonium thermophilum TaxID=223376 RepID=A0ABR3WKL6_9PEZI